MNSNSGIDAVEQNLLGTYPIGAPFADAARMLGFRSTAAAYTARCRGTFPVRVTRIGAGLAVRTSDLIDYLRTGQNQATPREVRREIQPHHAGRPTKSEQVEAQRRHLTVRELRAQSSLEIGGERK